MRHTADFWLKVVREYLSGKTRMTDLSKKYQMDIGKIKYRVNLYQMHGELPFSDEYEKRIYTREEKLNAIKVVLNGKKSGRQVALEMGIPNPHVVHDWVKKFQRDGEESIQISRGRKKYMLHEERQKYLANKELNDRLKALELENDYLKKSLALISKKNKRFKKKSELLMNLRANID